MVLPAPTKVTLHPLKWAGFIGLRQLIRFWQPGVVVSLLYWHANAISSVVTCGTCCVCGIFQLGEVCESSQVTEDEPSIQGLHSISIKQSSDGMAVGIVSG